MRILSQISDFLMEIRRRNGLLFYLGMGLFALSTVILATFGICGNPLAEVCHWLKPFKFAFSFGVYVFTLSWYMEYLKSTLGEKKIAQISCWVATLILLEMGAISLQSWQMSDNYNHLQFPMQTTQSISSVLHIFSIVTILITTAVLIYIASQFFRKIPLKPLSYLWGIRTGFLMFIFSCFLGGFLLHHYGQVPPDPQHIGFPFAPSSSTRVNLISLHFLGIHFLQLLPISGYFLRDRIGKSFIIFSAVFYLAACLFFLLKVT